MDDPLPVRGVDRVDDLTRDRERLSQGYRRLSVVLNDFVERPAGHELHDERVNGGRVFESVNLRDVGMVERSQNLRLAPEAREPIGVGRERLRQDLQRDVAIELVIARAVSVGESVTGDGSCLPDPSP